MYIDIQPQFSSIHPETNSEINPMKIKIQKKTRKEKKKNAGSEILISLQKEINVFGSRSTLRMYKYIVIRILMEG